jgi:pheromone shutdown protein TraB
LTTRNSKIAVAKKAERIQRIRMRVMIAEAVLVAAGGGWLSGREVRALVGDETTLAHRRSALAAGYWAMMAVIVCLYAYGLFASIRLVDALHLVLSFGLAAPLGRFAQLEWRAQTHD